MKLCPNPMTLSLTLWPGIVWPLIAACLLGGLGGTLRAAGPLVISEILADNDRGLRDEDDEQPDWIEIHNPTREAVELTGWSLALDGTGKEAWKFPRGNVAPGGYAVVFASGKNRSRPDTEWHASFKLPADGGKLVLRRPDGDVSSEWNRGFPMQYPDVSYGIPGTESREEWIGATAELQWQTPDGDFDEGAWTQPGFPATGWNRGTNGIGYELNSSFLTEFLRTDVSRAVFQMHSSIFLRIPWVMTDPAAVRDLRMVVRFDDGFVAWINGHEVFRTNAPANFSWSATSTSVRPDAQSMVPDTLGLGDATRHLVTGTNVLAVMVLNSHPQGSDLLFQVGLDSEKSRTDAGPRPPEYLAKPTPGGPNSSGISMTRPVIRNVRHPGVGRSWPKAGEMIPVTATVRSPSKSPLQVRLHYKVQWSNETAVAMADDGAHGDGAADDGVYGGAIPAGAKPGQMVRYYISAAGAAGGKARSPARANAEDAAYHGMVIADPNVHSKLRVLHVFTENPMQGASLGRDYVAVGCDGEFHDHVRINQHGQFSRRFPKPSYNLQFSSDQKFLLKPGVGRVRDIKLLSNWADKSKLHNTLSYDLIAASGGLGHIAYPVRIERNGKFHSVADLVEDGDARWLRRIGLSPEGSLYKMYENLTNPEGNEKKTRKDEDFSDLKKLVAALSEDKPIEQRAAFAYDRINLPQAANYFATLALMSSEDHGQKNFYLYCDTEGTSEWYVLPWDVDLTWGRTWTRDYFNDTIFTNNSLSLYNEARFGEPRNCFYAVLFEHPEFRQMYLRRLRTLLDEMFGPPGTKAEDCWVGRRILELSDLVHPPTIQPSDATRDYEKWETWGNELTMEAEVDRILEIYLPGRREFLYRNKRARTFGDRIPDSQPGEVRVRFLSPDATQWEGKRAFQYLALTNTESFSVDVSGWKLQGAGVRQVLKPGTVIPANSSLYLCADIVGFRSRKTPPKKGMSLFAQGDWQGELSRNTADLELVTRTRQVIRLGGEK